jgi:hypothetical protein
MMHQYQLRKEKEAREIPRKFYRLIELSLVLSSSKSLYSFCFYSIIFLYFTGLLISGFFFLVERFGNKKE